MLSVNFIKQNEQFVIERLRIKNFDAANLVKEIINVDTRKRDMQQKLEANQAEMNALSKEIGILFRQGKGEEANSIKARTNELKELVKEGNQQLAGLETELNTLIVQLPNLPQESVPPGKSAQDNEILRGSMDENTNNEGLLPHWELAKKHDIIDFELGNKISGAGFPVYKGKGAKLQRALISFFLDEAIKAGYEEVSPPLLVNEDSGFGTGQLPDKEGQMYHVVNDNLYLIPTAEVPVTNIYRDMILQAGDLPVKNTAYTPCFRREAGSYGKDVRGLNRLHQFDKVEIVQVTHPDQSYKAHEEMINHVEGLLRKLGLTYRIVKLCGGDMSFASALTYDFEVYSMAQQKWLEVSSVSNFETFQAHRLKLRIREKGEKKNIPAHTLNGSALALPRVVAALVENNQTPDGIKVPDVLVSYTGFGYL
jgi:seryl-tRNA synthetase